tara:strand:+ start:1849 stop:2304 length:456 start_codon:yes stop_codon:yes gene_type:complete
MDLKEVYHKASKLREEKVKSLSEFNQNFLHDSNLLRDALINIIKDIILQKIVSSDDNSLKKIIVFNIFDKLSSEIISSKKTSVKPKTFFTGFWQSSSRTYNLNPFHEAGISTMTDEINTYIKDSKIVLKDISDPTKSLKHVLEITIPPKPN